MRLRKRRVWQIGGLVLIAFLVGFLTWLIASVVTVKTDLELTQTYELPEFASLANLPEVDANEIAVAIDGDTATTSSKFATLDAEDSSKASLPTASTAKMILGLAVMEAKPFETRTPGETITITQEMYNRYGWYLNNGGSVVPVTVGEEISEYDALAAVFLASANNLADALAVWAFGSLDNYRDYATNMLHEWGLNDTAIGTDASGFSESTKSTAADLARIGQKVLQNPVLAEIVGLKEYTVPVAGVIKNTNQLLGQAGIVGVKTGYIGDASGYCLVTGYREGEHIITTALLGAATRASSFNGSLALVTNVQNLVKTQKLVTAGEVLGYYDSWWTGKIKITAAEDIEGIGWAEAEKTALLEMTGETGILKIKIGNNEYITKVNAENYVEQPSLGEKISHAFGWNQISDWEPGEDSATEPEELEKPEEPKQPEATTEQTETASKPETQVFTNAPSNNCTIKFGTLMLINPNFTVETEFINARRGELVSLATKYGIVEGNAYNGDNLLDAEAAIHINEMINAYKAAYPGHTMETRSCFRAVGTNCGRLCAATGASDHHTGLTCDLLDPAYGISLDTSTYNQHPDWQWLKANSYKYGFIDRFPEAWAGGSMDEPLNVDANGTTGLFETWHYRYVGVDAATEIATGKYNNGQYDSLEHYLLARGLVTNLKTGTCK